MRKQFFAIRGFTLLEVVISILVLMLGVGLLMYVFPAAIEYLGRSKDVTVATFFAQNKMEELKSFGGNIPASQFGEYAVPDNPNFMYKVEKLSLWGKYKEIKVSVNKPARTNRGQLIAQVYAAVSGIQESAPMGDVVTYYYDGGPNAQNKHLYYFYTDRKSRTIQWLRESTGHYGIVNQDTASYYGALSQWQSLTYLVSGGQWGMNEATAVIPDNGIPEKIWLETAYIRPFQGGGGGYGGYYYKSLLIFVADPVNNCIWRQVATVSESKVILNENWIKLPHPLPSQ